jgi:hypothetical protein
MKANNKNAKRIIFDSMFSVCGITAFCGLLLLFLPSCRRSMEQMKPSPPDLRKCTRIEIQLKPSTLEYFCPTASNRRNIILNSEEKAYLKSLDTIVVNDQKLIKALAHDISLLSYIGPIEGYYSIKDTIHFNCYKNSECVASFTIIGDIIQTKDGHRFENKGLKILQTHILKSIEQKIQRFQLRVECADNLYNLCGLWRWYLEDKNIDSDPSKWCDTIFQKLYKVYGSSEEIVKKHFACPAAGEGKCHYAMNPNCKPNSPLDTVLLFETKAGWNQHGGPELFTFDNHDPHGGCVLLNDGTIKFIRTSEELNQLRWK